MKEKARITLKTEYPILKEMNIVRLYKIIRLIFIIWTSSYFFGILWYIYINDVEEPKYYRNILNKKMGQIPDFKTTYINEGDTPVSILVKMWYFGITTLSTIGFGDYHPVSTEERILILPLLMFGVMIFSIIMSEYIEIILDYRSLNA